MRTLILLSFGSLSLAGVALAGDGTFEINQTCAVGSGCFPGDAAGFPVTISASGSYRLTSNLSNVSTTINSLSITASDVFVDLGGFSVRGPAACSGLGTTLACTGTGSGIGVNASLVSHVTIRNGVVRGAAGVGLSLGSNARIEQVDVESSGADGLQIGAASAVRDVVSKRNSGEGIFVGNNTLLEQVIVEGNRLNGVRAGVGAIVRASQVRDNGADGIEMTSSGVVSGCVVNSNGDAGIRVSSGSNVFDNAVYSNDADGIVTTGVTTISRNTVYSNLGDQIQAASSTLVGNTVRTIGGQGWALNLTSVAGLSASYGQNTLTDGGGLGIVTGGISLGSNVCNGVLC